MSEFFKFQNFLSLKKKKRVILIDNFDSFTFNIVDFLKISGAEVDIFRNDIFLEDIFPQKYDLLLISPGPGVPKTAGNLMKIIDFCVKKIPIFGICLGHEAIAEFFGGNLKFLKPVHGKSCEIFCDQKTIFQNLPKKFLAGRYHSLAINKIPPDFEISAKTADNEIMAIRHKKLPIESVQFHPESILTMHENCGEKILKNILQVLIPNFSK